MRLRAPFPWFGGKSRVAELVWPAFGHDVPNYVEPFAGSLAMLLGRPGGAGKIETVNDADRYLANFWRAVTAEPEAVAAHADWPVNEADLHARHEWLVAQESFRERMHADPDFYDVKIAGWWVWGVCAWIGSGWCAETGSSSHVSAEKAVRLPQKRPVLDGIGKGINGVTRRPLPDLAVAARSRGGRGVHGATARMPSLGNDRGIHGVAASPTVAWFRQLQSRLRHVRVACGDWSRVLGPSVLGKGKNVGGRRPCAVFLDPPYDTSQRVKKLYAVDETGLAAQVRDWALEHGNDPDLRIALCGYEGEHEMPGWTTVAWRGSRGFAAEENSNRELERVWLSPHCLPVERQQSLGLW